MKILSEGFTRRRLIAVEVFPQIYADGKQRRWPQNVALANQRSRLRSRGKPFPEISREPFLNQLHLHRHLYQQSRIFYFKFCQQIFSMGIHGGYTDIQLLCYFAIGHTIGNKA